MKLNGGNLTPTSSASSRIDRVVTRAQASRRVRDWESLLDFNEGCPTSRI